MRPQRIGLHRAHRLGGRSHRVVRIPAPYCATKAAVIQLAKVAAVEYARDGIRVNCVCPGTFRSAIHDRSPRRGARHHRGAPPARARRGRRPGRCLLLPGGRRVALDDRIGPGGRRRLFGAVILRARTAAMPRMKISAKGRATERAVEASLGLEPEIGVVVHAEPGPGDQPGVEVTELAGRHAGAQHVLDPALVVLAPPAELFGPVAR